MTYYARDGYPISQPRIDLYVRGDRLRVERMCKHGVGHPVATTRRLTAAEAEWVWVHGCDGCCAGWGL